MAKKLKIGLFGFGCVGQGLYHVLNNSTGFKADIVKVAVKDRKKIRSIPNDLITFDKWEILNNPEIDVIVELIDDAQEAFAIVSEALSKKKHVVTANKKMLALHLEELYELQQKNEVSLLYEGSVAGSIPIIRTLEEYFDNEELEKVSGIFNGTTNYILSKIINEKLSYPVALKQAQEKGFAESDPSNDVAGFDPKFKTVIIALHAFGLIIKPENILNIGITALDEKDINYAAEKGFKIKLTPVIQRFKNDSIAALVIPRFVRNHSQLFNVENEFNGVVLEGRFSGEQFLQGRGAGSLPTGAAVLSDISALSHGYKYEYKKHRQKHASGFTNDVIVTVYLRYNSPADLEVIRFTEIQEHYTGGDYNYVVGTIQLQTLVNQKEYLADNKLFISLVNDELRLQEKKQKQTQLKKEELITI
jgi:homoserine dehydrogenase